MSGTRKPTATGGPTAVEGTATLLSADDVYLFNEGTHYRLFDKLGAHVATFNGKEGVYFAVWAPNADYVSVVGDFNGWDRGSNAMRPHAQSGIWELLIPGLRPGAVYKYHVASRAHAGYSADKTDPFGFGHETPPQSASVVRSLEYAWGDEWWMRNRGGGRRRAMSIYEVHAGSWMHSPDGGPGGGPRPLTYRELAPRLAEYVVNHGFTHVEFLPIMEHPLYRSWGYQTTGYFAPTSRFGTPQDFMFLVDTLHQAEVGVILDWVPSHFPSDEHGLGYFDGTHLFEHADPRQGFHPDWKSLIFNYGRNEVRAFLISSAVFWLEKYHADGLRVDAVASMLYLDYSRREGEWIPNLQGGRENVEAIDFMRQLNTEVYRLFPDICTVAEESTAWPGVSKPVDLGGLGFGYKWDMGWMHDTLKHFARDPIHRTYHHHELTFRALYQYSENYVLPLSHDEVVHGKGSLLGRMPGDEWLRFANLRLLLANQWTQPGKKLLFMGGEFGQYAEWNEEKSLDWHLAGHPLHNGVQRLVGELNKIYREEPALHEMDCEPAGFKWVSADDAANDVITFLRFSEAGDPVLVVLNGTPVVRTNYILGVPRGGWWKEILNSDAETFGGSGVGNQGRARSNPAPRHGFDHSLTLTLPPLGALVLKPEAGDGG